MSIMKWDPLKDLLFMEKHIDKLINNSFKEKSYDWLPVVDVVENDNGLCSAILVLGIIPSNSLLLILLLLGELYCY